MKNFGCVDVYLEEEICPHLGAASSKLLNIFKFDALIKFVFFYLLYKNRKIKFEKII